MHDRAEYGTPKGRQAALERCLEIYRESGEEMDFTEPTEPDLPRLHALRCHVRLRYERFTAMLSRVWLWNVAFPVKMWFHFRFHREKPLKHDRQMIAAMLRDAFAREGIMLGDDLYRTSVLRAMPPAERPTPERYDLIFNRKRLRGS